MQKTAVSPTRLEDYSAWYQAVIQAAELAETSPVRGCMVIKPWGYGIWEQIQSQLDTGIKALGHENIYCPLFIPLSFLEKEAEHVEGFAKECAVVTHSKLVQSDDARLIPSSPLEEPLVVRPTSETIIGECFSRWIQSYRDLPMLTNQWANVVRWEMRTRLFLRTCEFLWQEGHTAHASASEANQHARRMLGMYQDFCEKALALPVIVGEKSKNETFPGAEITYTLEGIMQDGKALQLGTSHFLGQHFAKSCNMQYQDESGAMQRPWTTSWGVTTRLIGGIIMSHADDDGLICPPRVAPRQIIIIPVLGKQGEHERILKYCTEIAEALSGNHYHQSPIRVKVDTTLKNSGEKQWHWIKKGAPIRVFIGLRECNERNVCYTLRTSHARDKKTLAYDTFVKQAASCLQEVHQAVYERAKARMFKDITLCTTPDRLYTHLKQSSSGLTFIYWSDNDDAEEILKSQYSVTLRCYPDEHPHITLPKTGPCCFNPEITGKLTLIAKAY